MAENAQWVLQGIPQQLQTPGVNQGSIPSQVPKANLNNNLPWFLWALAGCGCLGFVVIPILIVVAIIAINPAARLKQAQENAAKTATQSAQTNSTDPTANWKTYSNSNFSLKYPPGWVAKYLDQQTVTLSPKTRQAAETSYDTILIYRIANPKSLTVDQIIHRTSDSGICCLGQFADSLVKKTDSINISGVEAKRYYLGDGIFPNDETYVLQNGYIYNFENNGGLKFREIYNQILSTFKFL